MTTMRTTFSGWSLVLAALSLAPLACSTGRAGSPGAGGASGSMSGGAGESGAGGLGTAGQGSAGAGSGSAGTSGSAGGSVGTAGASGSSMPDASAQDAPAAGGAGGGGGASAPVDANPGADAPAAGTPPPGTAMLSGKSLLAVYWGQNGWGATHNDQTTWEKPLADTCAAHPEYDVVILSFATQLAHTRNQPFVPETKFANHCSDSYDAQNLFLLKCDDIAAGVRACQAAGKRVLISIGGSTGSAGFTNDSDGQMAAQSVWNIFLGGTSSIRPFTNATLDGVDLDIEGGGVVGYAAFAKALRTLMDGSGHKYYITGAPQCPYPDAYLGPAAGRALGDAPSAFDFLFVQFYNNFCGYGTPSAFQSSFAMWKGLANGGPKILVGLPATTGRRRVGLRRSRHAAVARG